MKQKLILLFIVLLTTTAVWADIEINETTFPDENFRNWVLTQSYGTDGVLTDIEIASITSIKVYGKNIQSMTGVGCFTALKTLQCYNNQLTALDVSQNTALTTLYCNQNQIKDEAMDALVESLPTISGGKLYVIDNENEQNTLNAVQAAAARAKGWTPYEYNGGWKEAYEEKIAIDETKFPDANFRAWVLSQTYGSDGVLTKSEISNVKSIEVINCGIQSLKGIEYFTSLTSLWCGSNQLTELDMSKNTALTALRCPDNQLVSIDISQNTLLTLLLCNNNQLTSLDVSNNAELTDLYCYTNQLTALDVSKNTKLTMLQCIGNQLTELDVSKNTKLTKLYCYDNQLTMLDVSKNTALTELWCYNNQLTTLDVTRNTKLTELYCYDNQLTELNVSKCTALTILSTRGNKLTSLDVSKCTQLTTLYCHQNQLTELNVSGNTKLTDLYCYDNQLTELNVSRCTALTKLSTRGNKLTSLDVSRCTQLTTLYCHVNQLTALNVSRNTKLTDLRCFTNQLTELNVRNCAALTYLDCGINQLDTLDVSRNTKLIDLRCYNNQLTELNTTKNTKLTTLYCNSNQISGDAMDVLVESLHTTSEGHLYVVNDNDIYEQNMMTTDQVLAAKAKGWIPYYYDDNTDEWQEYAGVEPVIMDDVAIDGTNFPDEIFRNYLLSQPYGADGVLTGAEITCITYLDISTKDIQSLKGIDFFPRLARLFCGGNQLTELDVTKNAALKVLSAYYNKLTTLNVSKNTQLTRLFCGGNQLTELDVTKNAALKVLSAYYNKLTTLNVSKNTQLTYLECSDNQLTALDVTMNTQLTELYSYDNQLTELNVSKCTALATLSTRGNKLTALDVSMCTQLNTLYCHENQFTALNVSMNTKLTDLRCFANQLMELDVRNCPALTYLDCGINQIDTLDVSRNTKLTYLDCAYNQLTSLDVSKNELLTELHCENNQIRGEGMDTLVESLPNVGIGSMYVIQDSPWYPEHNVMTEPQVMAAKAKGWIPYYYDNITYEWLEYAGSEPDDDGGMILTIKITSEEGNEISENVSIIWYDVDGKEIGTGPKLNGIADSTEVYYSVLLDETLGRIYREVKMRRVITGEEDETITCQLEKIGRVMLEGRVSATDIDKTTATVNVVQMLNGKWEQIYTTHTDEQGVFKVEVYDDETDITISGEGYFDATIHRNGFGGYGNVGTIPLNLVSGFSLAANITIKKAVATGDVEDATAWTDGLNNIEFTLTNMTGNVAITDFTVQNGNVIIKTGASVGDEVQLTAKSKQGVFANATTSFIIANGANAFDLQLTELGGVDATCAASDNGGTIGFLYNSDDKLVAKGSYTGETLSLRHLPSGTYTLVSMGRSLLLGNLTNLSDLSSVGLSEGTDYVMTQVTVNDGELTAVNVNSIPKLDETRFYYTSNETYFNVNKPSITAGNYLTLQAHVDFKPEYADKTDGVMLTIDLPEGCQMVENSVIVNHQAVAHTMNGNRVTMNLSKEQYKGHIRFCVIPTLNQNYTVTAMASFDIDGQVTQPIGAAQFEAKRLSLSVPEKVASTNITVNGTAKGHSEVSIYDNDVLIGKTSSKADGSWTAECELYKPYSHSFHDIYAKIKTENGMELTSEVRQVEYNKYGNVPEKVMMTFYNGWMKKNIDVEFNLIEGTTTPSSYPFYMGTNFTFLADFTHNDSTKIKNVNIKVLNSDGTVRTLPATFDGKQNKWVATTKYENSNRLPQNVKVEYVLIPDEVPLDSLQILNDCNQFINLIKNYVTNVDTTKVEILDANESMMICKYQTYTMDTPTYIRMKTLDYEENIGEFENEEYFTVENNGKMTFMKDSLIGDRFVNWIWTIEDKMLLQLEICANNEFDNDLELSSKVMKAPSTTVTGGALDLLSSCFGVRDIVNEYNQGYNDLQNWLRLYNQTIDNHFQLYNKTKQLLEAKCPDGSIREFGQAYDWYSMYLGFYFDDANQMRESFKMRLGWMERDIERRRRSSTATSAALSALTLILPETRVGNMAAEGFGAAVIKRFGGTIRTWLLDNLGEALEGVYTSRITGGIEIVLGLLDYQYFTSEQMSSWYYPANADIIRKYSDLQASIKQAYKKCEGDEEDDEADDKEEGDEEDDEADDKEEDDDDDFDGKGATPEIDPSGYVYEAVTSNRLEGVTVTCYQKVQVEDMYGDMTEEAVVWDAEDYSQQNPLKTDATGFYRWDVPQGLWQVKYEKEGYETAYSDWLPVPPPQLDVNIGMKQGTPPTVTQMRGYESGITIDLSKYMRPETMTIDNITVTRNGTTESGTIEFLNAEKAPLGDETFVSKVKFVPENNFNASDIVVVTVHKEVESYCSVSMTADHVEIVKIEPEVKSIEVDEELTVAYQGERELRVLVLPKEASAGKTLHVKTSSEMIASVSATEVTIDQDGAAILTLSGELPGGAVLDFSVDGTAVTATSKVKVVIISTTVAVPTASIASGSTVAVGTQITLSCETEGAIIYYTTDGSCPCDENGSRMIYDGTPIIITEAVTIKAMAVVPDVGESDVAEFVYTVSGDDDGIEELALDDEIQVWPVPVRDKLNVTVGGKTIKNVTVSSMSGVGVASSNKEATTVTLDVAKIPAGIYIVGVTTESGNYSRKILKVQ